MAIPSSLQLLTTQAAAEVLQLNERTLENWRSLGRGPRFVKCGKCVRYRMSDLLKYLDDNSRQHTSDDGSASVVGA